MPLAEYLQRIKSLRMRKTYLHNQFPFDNNAADDEVVGPGSHPFNKIREHGKTERGK